MLTAKVVRDRVPIPHEPEEWMTFRMVSGTTKDKARDARLAKVFAMAKAAGPELRAEIEKARAGVPIDTTAIVVDSIDNYDVPTLLYAGIVAWSYDAAVSPHTIDDLDDVTRDWAGQEVWNLAHPTEEDRKNGSLPSIAPLTEMVPRRRGSG